MKILYAIQGTGNGHLSRARDIYPELSKYGTVDVLVSGIQADVEVPFPIKYKFYGLSFIFGSHGGVDFLETAKKLRLLRLYNDIRKLPVDEYDLVINDFEPISAWACKLRNKPCIALSHQSAVLGRNVPLPQHHDRLGELVLKRYAPHTAAYGFHFKAFNENVFTPVIRHEVRKLTITNEGHITVYLPSYNDHDLLQHFSRFPDVKWQVFSKHNKTPIVQNNIHIRPIENQAFLKSMAAAGGVLCGAGFEGPAEALYLGKKLMVIPMQNQYEQQCNAAALAGMGVPVIKALCRRYDDRLHLWLMRGKVLQVDYPDQTAEIVAAIMKKHL